VYSSCTIFYSVTKLTIRVSCVVSRDIYKMQVQITLMIFEVII